MQFKIESNCRGFGRLIIEKNQEYRVILLKV